MTDTFRVRTKGYIARGVLGQTKSYGNRPYQTDAEKYELTQPECLQMTRKLIGKPVLHKHNEIARHLEPVQLGKVVDAQFDPVSGDWIVELELEGLNAKLLWEPHFEKTKTGLSLSLSHNPSTMEPIEVSICQEPMREGSTIITNEDSYTGHRTGDDQAIQASRPTMSDKMDTGGGGGATPSSSSTSTNNKGTNADKGAAAGGRSGKDEKEGSAAMEVDYTTKENKLATIKKAADLLPAGPEREAYMKFEMELLQKADSLAEKEKYIRKLEKEKKDAEQRTSQLFQTFSQTIVDTLNKRGYDTHDMVTDMSQGHLKVNAPYMQEIAAAISGNSRPVKQPAAAAPQRQMSETEMLFNSYLNRADRDDSYEEKTENTSMTHQSVPLHGRKQQQQQADDSMTEPTEASYKPDSVEAYFRKMTSVVDNPEHTTNAYNCVPQRIVGRDLGNAGNNKRGLPEGPIGPSGGWKRQRVDVGE